MLAPDRFYLKFLAVALAIGGSTQCAFGQNSAPSSHMVFDDDDAGDIIVNQVRVPKDGLARYTYYEALGWRGRAAGYAGIQDHPRGRNFIFSIWDHKDHTGKIKANYTGPGTRVEGFGGEGTGLKSWNFELGWETDTWYTLVSRCWPVGDHTHFGFWVHAGDKKSWTHLVTMDVAVEAAKFRGRTDAFIEDWLNTGKDKRVVHYRNGWKRTSNNSWQPFTKARYSVNHWDLEKGKRSYAFRNHWDGGIGKDKEGSYFYMISGGKQTRPTTTNPSNFALPSKKRQAPNSSSSEFAPTKLTSLTAEQVDGKIQIRWNVDPNSSPLFQVDIRVIDTKSAQEIVTLSKIVPHQKSITFSPKDADPSTPKKVAIRTVDLFGRVSKEIIVAVSAK